jgi:class 3 adenylate cyclase
MVELLEEEMSLRTELTKEVTTIFADQWAVRDGRVVPDPEDIQHGNHASKLDAVVLYADLSYSTVMVDTEPFHVAAEVYKTYLHCSARVIKANDGVITAYDGDRIMAVFVGDSKNTNAAKTGLQITWAVNKIINPGLRAQYGGDAYQVTHVVGVDSSLIRAARIGVRNDNDLVWVGSAANHAAKLSSISDDHSVVFISKQVYDRLRADLKVNGNPERNMWSEMTYDGNTVYRSGWQWSI